MNILFIGDIFASPGRAIVAHHLAEIVAEEKIDLAIANAENRSNDVDVDKLFVTEAYVNEGPRMKRVRPAPMGRAFRYQRRMAHIVVKVGDVKAGAVKAGGLKGGNKG